MKQNRILKQPISGNKENRKIKIREKEIKTQKNYGNNLHQ